MERPCCRCVAADCNDSEESAIAGRSAAGRAGVIPFVAGGRDGEEEMACSGLFSHERLAAVAMRASVTGSPLYAGLCGEKRWRRPFGDGLRQEEGEDDDGSEQCCECLRGCVLYML